MTDLAYIIESADVRLPNACPELPDMENEQVSERKLITCFGCGKEIVVDSYRRRYCPECKIKARKESKARCNAKYTKKQYMKPRVNTTENVREATREAMRHGISYGKYMQLIRK